MPPPNTITSTQNHLLQYVGRHETPEYGVIIRYVSGEAMITRGYMTAAPRRRYSREVGICVRLTDKGRKWLDERS